MKLPYGGEITTWRQPVCFLVMLAMYVPVIPFALVYVVGYCLTAAMLWLDDSPPSVWYGALSDRVAERLLKWCRRGW